MENVENLAMETYLKNIEYLSSEHKELNKLLNMFEMALQKGDYVQEYELEYIDGCFDIKIANSNKFLYSSSAESMSKELTKRVNLQKTSYAFEGMPVYNFSQALIDGANEEIKFIDGLFPLMKYYYLHTTETDLIKNIHKYIFIGVGQGNHIAKIHKKISAKHYFIIEDTLELFRLSLFTTPYYKIAKDAELYFSIADDENIFLRTMNTFLDTDFFDNRFLKYTHFPAHSNNKIKQIQNALTTQSFIFFPYKAELFKYLRPLEYINNGYNTINLITNIKSSLFSDKPTLVIGAGPSLQKNIEWLKNNHEKFVIIAVSAVLSTLHKHNITPDIVTQLDGTIETLNFYKDVSQTNFLQNSLMFFGSNVPQDIRKLFTKEQIFYYEEGADYFKDFGSISTPCVGSFSILLSLILNVKETYLLGLDLALNQETGETHSSEHLYSEKRDMNTKSELKNTMSHTGNIFPVQGNFTDLVYTNALLHASIQSLYRHIPHIKQANQTIYNLNNGAKINQAIPKFIDDVAVQKYTTLDKKELFKAAQNVFEMFSTKFLSADDYKSLTMRLENAKYLHALLEKYTNDVSHTNTDRYFYDLLGLVSTILHRQNRESTNLSHVYLQYFKHVLPLAMDLFNTQGLKNEKRHIKKIDKMIQDEMYDICDIYIKSLEDFIEKRA